MATMDIIKHHGGEPANFLDCGGGVTEERVCIIAYHACCHACCHAWYRSVMVYYITICCYVVLLT